MIYWIKSICKILVSQSRKEYGIKTKIMENCSIGFSMTEWINIPSNVWRDIKFLTEPLVSFVKILNYIFVVGITLISANPSSHSDLKLAG